MLYFRYIYIVYLYHKSYNVLEGGAIMKESTGEKIKRLRKEKGITAVDFANMIGVSRMQVYRYESDQIEKMPYTVLIPIAKALNTTPMELLDLEPPKKTKPCDYDDRIKMLVDIIGEFSDEEFEELANYAKYIVSKRK